MTATRKLLTIICEADLETRLGEDAMRLGAHGFTVTDARGRGSRGLRDASWDMTANIRMEIICEERVAETIAQHLRSAYSDNYAMVLYMTDVSVLRADKF